MIELSMWTFFIILIINFIKGVYDKDNLQLILGIFLMIVGFWFAIQADFEGYERGQIDALKGEQHYEMKIKQDTSYVKK